MVTLKFNPVLSISDPQLHPVLIIGQVRHLSLPGVFAKVQQKLGGLITEELFNTAVSYLHPAPIDTCSLYLDLVKLGALPLRASRHNTQSRCHSITKLVKANVLGVDESIVLVCERADLYASAAAVARAFPEYSRKTGQKSTNVTVNVEFVLVEHLNDTLLPLFADDILALSDTALGVRLAAKIVDAPCNEMDVSRFVAEVGRIGSLLGLTPVVIRGEELNQKGFGGIYGVGKAAVDPPALCVLSHTPDGATETVAWVGKGIVYDTGGLSIKGKTAMPGMKRDCGGAAAILGAFYAAVRGGFNQNLHAVFCLAENAVGPQATRPDDVHTLYSGKTVEINNTDAEGRLVLADGVSYADKDLKATIIVDMATLTGAQGTATGKYHSGIVSNNEDLERQCVLAGRVCGDLCHPLPFSPELHFPEFTSAIADMKNSVADRSNAQSSCAALFIFAHLGFDYAGSWLHIDMAYPVHCGERATGYGVALLVSLFAKYMENPLLKSLAPIA